MRIVVIGAGLLGVSTAFFLRNSGHEVVVVERNSGPGLDTSFANGGMLTPSQAGPWNYPGIGLRLLKWFGRKDSPLIIQPRALISLLPWGLSFLKKSSASIYSVNLMNSAVLAGYSLQTLQNLNMEFEISYERSCRGSIKIFRSNNQFQQACKMLESANLEQISHKFLETNRVIQLEPSLYAVKDQIAGGIYYPDDEVGDAYQFCNELARVASHEGVNFHYGTTVNGMRCEGNNLKGLDTSSGQIDADFYILAAGCYSPKLASMVGLSLPIKPVKGYSVTFNKGAGGPVPEIPVIDESRHIAVTPFHERLRISGTAELSGYDTSINKKRITSLLDFYRELFPELYSSIDSSSISSWSGLRPYSCDGLPILGTCKINNLFLNTGHGHLGWTMAAGSGKLISDLICKGKTDLDIKAYNIDRFFMQ